jgi:hypothetical protein
MTSFVYIRWTKKRKASDISTAATVYDLTTNCTWGLSKSTRYPSGAGMIVIVPLVFDIVKIARLRYLLKGHCSTDFWHTEIAGPGIEVGTTAVSISLTRTADLSSDITLATHSGFDQR